MAGQVFGVTGPKGQLVGFKSADIIIFTVNRFLALYGWPRRPRPLEQRRSSGGRSLTEALPLALLQDWAEALLRRSPRLSQGTGPFVLRFFFLLQFNRVLFSEKLCNNQF